MKYYLYENFIFSVNYGSDTATVNSKVIAISMWKNMIMIQTQLTQK